MATKQVLLVKPVKGLGNEGEAVKVRAGYARNYLFPQGQALPVNRSTKRQLEVLAKRREERLTRELSEAKALAERLSSLIVTVMVKTGEDGKPHGAITSMEIQKALTALGFEIERHHIKIGEPLKTLGEHIVAVKIHPEVSVDLKINVASENPAPEKKAEEPRKKAHYKEHKAKSEKTEKSE
jgi:large subunit ribosomal protein L9